jgi:hypothetical protein
VFEWMAMSSTEMDNRREKLVCVHAHVSVCMRSEFCLRPALLSPASAAAAVLYWSVLTLTPCQSPIHSLCKSKPQFCLWQQVLLSYPPLNGVLSSRFP